MGQLPLEDEFGDIIKKARAGIGFTLGDLSERTNIPSGLLREIEEYKYRPSEPELNALASGLGLSAPKLNDILSNEWYPEKVSHEEPANVIIIEGTIGSYKVNGYILMDRKNGVAVAFDTGNSSRRVLQCLKENGLKLLYVFLTHGHSDHTGGLNEICRVTGAVIGLPDGEPDIEMDSEMSKNVFVVKDGSEIKAGVYEIKAVWTPGHTKGSTCYVSGNYCFSGDTIFAGSVGGAYSIEGYKSLLHSVSTKILSLNGSVRLFPGHGPVTTVGEEVMHNPFFGEVS